MSSRVVTTPWFTKNFAGGCSGGELLLRGTRDGRERRDGSATRGPGRYRIGTFRAFRKSECEAPVAYDPAVLLAIDVGNSNVSLGSFRNGSLIAQRRAATPRGGTPDDLEVLLEDLLRLDDAAFADVSAIVCASVVPAVTDALEGVAERRERPLLVAGPGTIPIAIRTDRPGDVGPDRLVNALAASRLYGAPAVVIDLGTATTFDCLSHDGAFVGGAIAPGVEMGLDSLASRTARLPRVELRLPDRAIGRDTVGAIQ